MSDEIIKKKIVLATYAFNLPLELRDNFNGATHEWTCLLRGREPCDDLSTFIKRVTFTLHPSFINAQRVCEKGMPFSVQEHGWGEFEISCKLTFIDPDERSVELKHHLKLYPENTLDISTVPIPDISTYLENCVVAETHDELIFRNPSKQMRSAILESSIQQLPPHSLSRFFVSEVSKEEAEFISMHMLLQHNLRNEVDRLKNELLEKTEYLYSLMNIYYACRPDRALSLLTMNPQIFSLCSLSPVNNNEKNNLIKQIRELTKDLSTNQKNNCPISGRKIDECIEIYSRLVENGLLEPLSNNDTGVKSKY